MKLAPNPIGILVLSGIASISGLTIARAVEPAKDISADSQGNPLRVLDSAHTDSSKKNKVVRGSSADSSVEGSIDFVIIDPAANSNTVQVAAPPSKKTADVTSGQAGSNITGSHSEHHAEYERLHAGAGLHGKEESRSKEVTLSASGVVYGEDTDNPRFTSTQELDPLQFSEVEEGMEPPELMVGQLDAEELSELKEFSLEDSNQQMPEMIDRPSQLDEIEAPDRNDVSDSGLTARSTLRRPKPILIDPIETSLPKSGSKPNIIVKDKNLSNGGYGSAQTKTRARAGQFSSAAEEVRSQRISAALLHYAEHPESVAARSPWAVMHAILPYGANAELTYKEQRVNAIAWMSANKVCKTQSIFTPVGKSFRPNVGGGVQGHEGQFLAILAQSGVSSNYPIFVNNQKFAVSNLVQYEMATCKPKTELTFKLIGLSYYLGTKQAWRSRDRQVWNVERLLAEELVQPVNGAACGGTHRLMGIHIAVKQRQQEGMPLTGKFATAEKYISDYKEYAWSLQNPDGSFSTNWFESRGMENNDERKVQTTGHILEWLIFSSTPAELRAHRTDAAIDFLLSKIYDKRDYKWPIGPRGHALRAIVLYQAKSLDMDAANEAASSVAREPNASSRNR